MTTPNAGGAKAPRRPGIADDARLLVTAVDGALRDTEGRLVRMMRERPLVAIGAAAGAGYLLGGGLTPRIAARLITTGGRMMLAATLERWLVDQLGLSAGSAPRAAAREAAAREEESRKDRNSL